MASHHDDQRHAAEWIRDPRALQLVFVGLTLVVSGFVHIAVWGVLGGPWEGPITWRKPILFGISGGLTALSLAWVWAHLPRRRGDDWLAAAAAWALLVEVALIDVQKWRGVASHFNRATPLDSLLYDVMGGLILFVTAAIVDLTIRVCMQRVAMPADMRLAARAGLVLLSISCLIGIWASALGDMRAAAGLEPAQYGAAGVPKFPHGVVIHAIQWLPLLAWIARRAGLDAPVRVRLVASATIGSALVLAYAVLQTLAGRSRFDAGPVAAAVLLAGSALLAGPAAVIAWTGLRLSASPAGRFAGRGRREAE